MSPFGFLTIVQLGVCFTNVLMGLFLLRNKLFFRLEIKYILSFCILDFATSTLTTIDLFFNVKVISIDIINIIFEFGEFIFLPAYIIETTGIKHNWKVIIIVCIIFLTLSFLNPSLFEPLIQVFTTIFITSFCFKYLKWIFNSDDIVNITQTKHFWIIIGITICYTSSIPSSLAALLMTFIGTGDKFNNFINVMYVVYFFLNIIMHCFFIKSFKWKEN